MSGTAVLIPARGGSLGIPRKNLVNLCGRPLIAWSIFQAAAARVGPIWITTDDGEIEQVSLETRTDVSTYVIREPLRDGTTTMEEVIRFALERMNAPDWVVLLQPTSPLRLADHILNALVPFSAGSTDSVFSVTETYRFIWRTNPDYGGQIEMEEIEYHRRERVMRQDLYPRYAENGSIYIMRVSKFLEEGTRFCGKTVPYVMPGWTEREIDGPEDLEMVSLILADRLRQGHNGVTS